MSDAAYRKACPVWANMPAILSAYPMAVDMTAATGVKYEVDHVIPLMHPLVCGLHVEGNLRVITKKANASKGNRWSIQ